VKELKGFLKVYLKPKERTTIKLELSRRDLAFFDEKSNTWVVEDGDFEILIGSSSRDIRLKGKFRYKN
jgi:beta-glucosidase